MFSIPLSTPKPFTGANSWFSKEYGVVLVQKEEDIEPLWKLLCEQDEYWEKYRHLIKVTPKETDFQYSNIRQMLGYCGKTDIDDVESIRKQIPFIIYQQEHEY